MEDKKYKAIFLDRDGTLNKEINYLHKISDFEWIAGTIEALRIFKELGYLLIIVTNQAGIAKGYYSEEEVIKLHQYMNLELAKMGIMIDAYYYCPHHPDGTVKRYTRSCNCRKPRPGMILSALDDFEKKSISISLDESIMVGDKESDILAGINAGIKLNILVKSGHDICERSTRADAIFDDLLEFALNLKDGKKIRLETENDY